MTLIYCWLLWVTDNIKRTNRKVTFSFIWSLCKIRANLTKSNALKWGEYSHAVYQTGLRDDIKVHLTPKYFFRSNKSLHLFEMHRAFSPHFNPNLDVLQAVKVTKSGHHLLHDRASKGYGAIPGLRSQTSLHACLQRLNTMQISLWHQTRNRPMPFISSVVW